MALVAAFDSPGGHAQENGLHLQTGNDWEGLDGGTLNLILPRME